MVSYRGFDTKYITMQCINSEPDNIKVGDYIKVSEDGDVRLADSNKPFFGVVVGISGNYYTVQISGYYEVSFAGDTLPMYTRLALNKRGVLQTTTSTDSPIRRVVWVDRVTNHAGVIL